MAEFQHYTVLKKETVDGLDIKPDGIYVDCTLGGAGHSEYLLNQLNENGHLYAFDQDIRAIEHAKERLAPFIEKRKLKKELKKAQKFAKENPEAFIPPVVPDGHWRCMGCGEFLPDNETECNCGYKKQ